MAYILDILMVVLVDIEIKVECKEVNETDSDAVNDI
jgi:hypothetical protein